MPSARHHSYAFFYHTVLSLRHSAWSLSSTVLEEFGSNMGMSRMLSH